MQRGSILARYPRGGHRGALYAGDLYAVAKRAAYRPDFVFIHNKRGVDQGAPPHCCGLSVGHYDVGNREEMRKLPDNIGPICNVKMEMVPEFTVLENVYDPESEVYATGWRKLLERWLKKRIIRMTPEIRDLLGPDWYLPLT